MRASIFTTNQRITTISCTITTAIKTTTTITIMPRIQVSSRASLFHKRLKFSIYRKAFLRRRFQRSTFPTRTTPTMKIIFSFNCEKHFFFRLENKRKFVHNFVRLVDHCTVYNVLYYFGKKVFMQSSHFEYFQPKIQTRSLVCKKNRKPKLEYMNNKRKCFSRWNLNYRGNSECNEADNFFYPKVRYIIVFITVQHRCKAVYVFMPIVKVHICNVRTCIYQRRGSCVN